MKNKAHTLTMNMVVHLPTSIPADIPPGLNPKEAIIRELDFDIVNGNLTFFFKRAWGPIDINITALDDILRKVASARYVDDMSKLPWKENSTKMVQPFGSTLSMSNRYLRHVIYVLSNKNWCFSGDYVPITMDYKLEGSDIYFAPLRVLADGTTEDVAKPAKPFRCKVACFVADGAKAVLSTGKYKYPHGINFNVDLIDDANGTIMPLVIDPDIRYPGGNTLVDPE